MSLFVKTSEIYASCKVLCNWRKFLKFRFRKTY